MLKYWSLSHFKSVFRHTSLELTPLTIFAGANSAGKSTIIQNMLLTTQTLQSPVISRPVVLNGHIARLGAFTDVVSNADENSEVSIGFGLEFPPEDERRHRSSIIGRPPRFYYRRFPPEASFTVECGYSFSIKGDEIDKDILRLQPLLESSEIVVKASFKDNIVEEAISIRRSREPVQRRLAALKLSEESLVGPEINSLDYEIIKLTPAKVGIAYADNMANKRNAGASLHHFLPSRTSVVFDSVETEVRQVVEALTAPATGSWRDLDIDEESSFINENVREIVLDGLNALRSSFGDLRPIIQNTLDELQHDFTMSQLRKVYRVLSPSMQGAVAQKISERKDELRRAIKGGRPSRYDIRFLPLPDLLGTGVDATAIPAQKINHYFSVCCKK